MLLGSFTDFLDFPRFSQEEAFASQPSDRSGRHAQGARGSGGWQLLSGSDPWWFFGKGVRGFWWLASSSNWGALKSPTEQFPTPPFSLGGVHGGSKQQARSSSISGKTHFKGSDGPDEGEPAPSPWEKQPCNFGQRVQLWRNGLCAPPCPGRGLKKCATAGLCEPPPPRLPGLRRPLSY